MKCLTEKGASWGEQQKKYADHFALYFSYPLHLIVGEAGGFVGQRAEKEFGIFEDEVNSLDAMGVALLNLEGKVIALL